ncbi:MAG: VOC family protein [Pseudomonadota bacterium]
MKFHLSLPVSNIHKTAQFYRILFQSEATKLKDDYVKFEPERLALTISFIQSKSSSIDTSQHLGLQFVSSEKLDAYYQWLDKHQLISKTKSREKAVCCYANQDKFWVNDPDGYEWELYYRIDDSDYKSQASQCCK